MDNFFELFNRFGICLSNVGRSDPAPHANIVDKEAMLAGSISGNRGKGRK